MAWGPTDWTQSVANIFAAKGRPQDNPLILHTFVCVAERYCRNIPDAALPSQTASGLTPLL